MRQKSVAIVNRIHIGFSGVVLERNFADSHRPLPPFGMKWGRGILIKGPNYLEAVTGSYGTSHSNLKNELRAEETSRGAFYYGYELQTKTLFLEFASDRTFDFQNDGVLEAIINSLKRSSGPLKDMIVEHPKKAP